MALTIGGKRRKPGGRPPAVLLTPVESRLVNRLVTVMNVISASMDSDAYTSAILDLNADFFERLLSEIDVVNIGRLLEDTLRGVVLSGGTQEARQIIRDAPRVGQNPFVDLEYTGRTLPSGIIMPGPTLPEVPDMEFVIEDPVERMFKFISQKATDYATTRSAQLVTSINESNRVAIREVISQAFTGPRTVDQTARSLRQIVGLHPRWARAVIRFNDDNVQRLLKQGLSPFQAQQRADEMTDKYRRKLIRRRAEMIARTEIQQAQNFGREASWQASDRAGLIDARSEKQWMTAPESSRYGPPCPICTSLKGTRVPWNGTFANGHTMPPAHPNCRCTAVVVPPTRGLEGLPSQDMGSWIDQLDALEAEDSAAGLVLEPLAKHLPGQHDQQRHAGTRGSASTGMSSAERAKAAAESGEPCGLTVEDIPGIKADPEAYGVVMTDSIRREQRRDGFMPDEDILVRQVTGVIEDGEYIRRVRKQVAEEQAREWDGQPIQENTIALLDEVRERGTVMVASTGERAQKILQDGEFKTVFETFRSNGAVAHEARRREEYASHDLHPTVEDGKRPVYGYIAFDNPTIAAAAGYGAVRFELKPEAKARTTVTIGDSLGSRATPIPMTGGKVTNVEAAGASFGWGSVTETRDFAESGVDVSKVVDDAGWGTQQYVEAQISGGLKVSDIAAIHVDTTYMTGGEDVVGDMAERMGIPITYH